MARQLARTGSQRVNRWAFRDLFQSIPIASIMAHGSVSREVAAAYQVGTLVPSRTTARLFRTANRDQYRAIEPIRRQRYHQQDYCGDYEGPSYLPIFAEAIAPHLSMGSRLGVSPNTARLYMLQCTIPRPAILHELITNTGDLSLLDAYITTVEHTYVLHTTEEITARREAVAMGNPSIKNIVRYSFTAIHRERRFNPGLVQPA